MDYLSWLLLLLPLFSAVVLHLFASKRAPWAPYVSTMFVLVTFIISLHIHHSSDKYSGLYSYEWILHPPVSISLPLHIDSMALGMMLIVTGVGVLVHLFSIPYMAEDSSRSRYFSGLSLFMFSMTGIVLAGNFIMMFIFWELVGLSSYLLIGHWFEKKSAADAAKKAFIVNRVGDFGFLVGILLIWGITGSYTFDSMHIPESVSLPLLGVAVLCIFCGAMGKSAQAPLHVWLPDAMEGPTPVSALIHAATMVAAGVYMMARFFISIQYGGFSLESLPSFSTETIIWIGAVTSLLAALAATQQDDIKKILAYSTLSQLGYMVVAIGLLKPDVALFHLYTHAWFKALLFLGAGAVIYACHHQQNIWKMGGLAQKIPVVSLTFFIGALALSGCPFITSGFFSKEQILTSAYSNPPLFWVLVSVAFLTTFYMFRLFFVTFMGKASKPGPVDHPPGPMMQAPLVILAILAVITGYKFVAEGYAPLFHYHKIKLGVPLYASFAAFLVGFILAALLYARNRTEPFANNFVTKMFRNSFYIDKAYNALIVRGLNIKSACVHLLDEFFVTGFFVNGLSRLTAGAGNLFSKLQNGSLQVYAIVFILGAITLIYLTVLF